MLRQLIAAATAPPLTSHIHSDTQKHTQNINTKPTNPCGSIRKHPLEFGRRGDRKNPCSTFSAEFHAYYLCIRKSHKHTSRCVYSHISSAIRDSLSAIQNKTIGSIATHRKSPNTNASIKCIARRDFPARQRSVDFVLPLRGIRSERTAIGHMLCVRCVFDCCRSPPIVAHSNYLITQLPDIAPPPQRSMSFVSCGSASHRLPPELTRGWEAALWLPSAMSELPNQLYICTTRTGDLRHRRPATRSQPDGTPSVLRRTCVLFDEHSASTTFTAVRCTCEHVSVVIRMRPQVLTADRQQHGDTSGSYSSCTRFLCVHYVAPGWRRVSGIECVNNSTESRTLCDMLRCDICVYVCV